MLTENKYDESMLEIEQSPGLLQSPEDNSNIPQTSEVMILSYSKWIFLNNILDASSHEYTNEDGTQQSMELLIK